MARFKNINWNTNGELRTDGRIYDETLDGASVQVLMDIRDELKQLNAVFACHNAQAVPNLLRLIAKNTTKRRRKAGQKK